MALMLNVPTGFILISEILADKGFYGYIKLLRNRLLWESWTLIYTHWGYWNDLFCLWYSVWRAHSIVFVKLNVWQQWEAELLCLEHVLSRNLLWGVQQLRSFINPERLLCYMWTLCLTSFKQTLGNVSLENMTTELLVMYLGQRSLLLLNSVEGTEPYL